MIKINRLTQITERDGKFALFLCDCGTKKRINFFSVKSGGTKSCGCLGKEAPSIRSMKNTSEEPWIVSGKLRQISNREGRYALFRCECGTEKLIKRYSVKIGATKTCGCSTRTYREGEGRDHPLWSTWNGMLYRCYNPNSPNYKDYGGRGISVCNGWKDSFSTFVRDMGERPKNHTLDRKDNDGNYSPSNCKWSTPEQQVRNRRSQSGGTSKWTGVHWGKDKKKWIARICHYMSGKETTTYVGSFDDEIEAAKAYDLKVREMGIDKVLNFN